MKRKIVALSLSMLIFITGVSVALGTDDPLITESYLKNVFLNEVKEYIDSKGTSSFNVVTVKKGSSFTGGSGCEFILRQGTASVLASELGGLSDVTAGYDIISGVDVPPNHLLIIPRDDGRGFIALTDVVIMVKGSYTIK